MLCGIPWWWIRHCIFRWLCWWKHYRQERHISIQWGQIVALSMMEGTQYYRPALSSLLGLQSNGAIPGAQYRSLGLADEAPGSGRNQVILVQEKMDPCLTFISATTAALRMGPLSKHRNDRDRTEADGHPWMDHLVLLITDGLLQSGCPSESLHTGHKYLHILCSFQNSIHMPLFHTNFSPILQRCSFRVLDPCSQTVTYSPWITVEPSFWTILSPKLSPNWVQKILR